MLDLLLKRLLDILGAAVGLALLSPVMCVVAVVIKASDGGPVFYRARRVGRSGSIFAAYKFRTMLDNADSLGPGITAQGDPRVTRLGRWLRRTKLDETPQLFNVLKGDMTLVGPRPEDPRYVRMYTKEQQRLLSIRPGITGAASLAFRREEELLRGPNWEDLYCKVILPEKLAIELSYLSQRSVLTDALLLVRTVWTLGWRS